MSTAIAAKMRARYTMEYLNKAAERRADSDRQSRTA
jgi:hypothetical protein